MSLTVKLPQTFITNKTPIQKQQYADRVISVVIETIEKNINWRLQRLTQKLSEPINRYEIRGLYESEISRRTELRITGIQTQIDIINFNKTMKINGLRSTIKHNLKDSLNSGQYRKKVKSLVGSTYNEIIGKYK